jgi:cytochrome bd-type quinol oxidase subunit 2
MAETAEPSRGEVQERRGTPVSRRSAAVAGIAALAFVLWGGYGRHWHWTGINGHTATLWDWLHLLLLPVVVSVLPFWLSRRTRVQPRHKVFGLTLLAVFLVLVLVGYTIPWGWTGFSGNRLWDWLELLVLPLVLALAPVMLELRDSWNRRSTLVAAALAAAFAVVVLGGYLGGWKWTGFHGNTLWNWMQLWLLPLLIPLIVVPVLEVRAMSGVTVLDKDDPERDQSRPSGPASTATTSASATEITRDT